MSAVYVGRVSPKGQVTLPAEVRQRFGIEPGQYVEIEVDSTAERPTIQVRPRRSRILDLAGRFAPNEAGPATWDEIVSLAKDEAVERILAENGLDTIASFDRHFDRFPSVTRIERV